MTLFSLAVGELASQEPDLPLSAKIHCSGCHQAPRPGSMTQDAWEPTIQTMFEMAREKNVPVPTAPQFNEIVNFYVQNSPEKFRPVVDDLEETKLKFEKMAVGSLPVNERPQATNVRICDLDSDGKEDDVVVTDNEHSTISWLRLDESSGEWKETVLAKAPAPVRTNIFDFDQDGDMDIAVAAMGFMHPNDDLIGEFHLLINRGDQTFEQKTVLRGTPRITDIAPGDFDKDGDIDFVVAMFGWRKTGGIGYLEQKSPTEFTTHPLLQINGTMRVMPAFVDDDDKLDFLALITQEHETVAAFIQEKPGKFRNSILARANHPVFGSSGIQFVDLDGDGDKDLLYTNGDMMDENPLPKPFHGVRWFENKDGEWVLHHLAEMPGCYCGTASDMDGDGDLDIVASALYFHWDQNDFPSLIWLENTGGAKEFIRRKIAYAPTNLASHDVGDLNGDGLPDIVAAGMHIPGPLGRKGRLTVWLQKK
ncbi:MAG: VCBS repeat-containing protein [Verrucomicrobiales bacterium]|nr:VCBS repeat-containing protein [Verrucomicrobiales bacterium]